MSTELHEGNVPEHNNLAVKKSVKISKWGIASFIWFVLNIIGFPKTPASYTSLADLGIQIFGIVIELGILGYIVFYIKKSGLRGLQIAKISLYGVALINAYFIIASLYLIGPTREIESFAINTTKNILKTDFVELKKVSTKDLVGQLTYADDLKDFTDAINAAGPISECSFTESSYSKATLGFYSVFKGYSWGLQGEYSVRCYGSKGYITFTNSLRKVDRKWLIYELTYTSSNPKLQKSAEEKADNSTN